MKKFILFLLVGIGLLSGCTGEDSPSDSSNRKIQRFVMEDADGDLIVNQVHEYIGEKLDKVFFASDDYHKYYYTNDFITRIDVFRENVLTSTAHLEYDANGKLLESISYSGVNGYRISHVYNSDNTVSVTEYTGDLNSQTTVLQAHKVFLENGIAVKIESYGIGEETGITYTREYTYDNKNNPMYAILGYGRLTMYQVGSTVSPNNITKIVYSQSDRPETSTYLSTYTYNSRNFPTSRVETTDGVLLTTAEYFY